MSRTGQKLAEQAVDRDDAAQPPIHDDCRGLNAVAAHAREGVVGGGGRLEREGTARDGRSTRRGRHRQGVAHVRDETVRRRADEDAQVPGSLGRGLHVADGGIGGIGGDGSGRGIRLHDVAASVVLHNYDMHAKNIGLLHYPDGGVVLAPMYDVIPSADLNVDQSFALAVNGRREADEITLADVAAEGRSWSIRQPERIVAEVAEVVVETARVERLPQYR